MTVVPGSCNDNSLVVLTLYDTLRQAVLHSMTIDYCDKNACGVCHFLIVSTRYAAATLFTVLVALFGNRV